MLQLNNDVRQDLWQRLLDAIESYMEQSQNCPVSPQKNATEIREALKRFNFDEGMPPLDVLDFAVEQLSLNQVHTPNPNYYGLFNPAPAAMGIAADTLVAAFNPQLASWNHSPFAIEVEQHLVRALAGKFGYDPRIADGTFTSGGAEANHTALLCALAEKFPSYKKEGLQSLPQQPVFYVSAESHHSFMKAARMCGLGTESVRTLPVDEKLRLEPTFLQEQIAKDVLDGFAPFMLVATAGTTNAGTIDPIEQLADIAEARRLWFHADAAWGGAAVLVPELKRYLAGIARADSITFDCHKWLSVPMGAGLFLTRHPRILDDAFRVHTAYMPSMDADGAVDPYAHSMQWSRRFIGLKVFMSLAERGWSGYADVLRHQTAMGDLLRERLTECGWKILNDTPLPIVCFVDGRQGDNKDLTESICRNVVNSNETWISTTRIGGGTTVLRACITNYKTEARHIEKLISELQKARKLVCV